MTRQVVAILGVLLSTQIVTAQVAEHGGDGDGAGALRVHAAADCLAASITAQPQNQTIQSGQTATLAVSATGSAPIHYQWYQGGSGDRTQPVGSDANTFTTPPLTSTTSYWVLVDNWCGAGIGGRDHHGGAGLGDRTLGAGGEPRERPQPEPVAKRSWLAQHRQRHGERRSSSSSAAVS